MRIYSSGFYGRTNECALHLVGYLCDVPFLISFAGNATNVYSLSSSISKGERIFIYDEKVRKSLFPDAKHYKKIETKVGDIRHCVMIHRALIYEKNSPYPVVVAEDGDTKTAINKYITTRFPVPKEFDYTKILECSELRIMRNPIIDKPWDNLRLVRLKNIIGAGILNEHNLINAIDTALKTGVFTIPPTSTDGKFDPSWTVREYLKNNALILTDQIKKVKPKHNPETDKLDKAIGMMERIPFPAQAHAIQGIVNALKEMDTVIVCGTMGSGKSIISLGVCNVLAQKKPSMPVLLTVPSVTIPKWDKKEIKETLPDANTYIIRSTDDAARYLRMIRNGHKPKMEFVILGIDRAKLGPDLWLSAVWKRIGRTKKYAWHCPDCGLALEYTKKKEEHLYTWEDFAEGEPPAEIKKPLPNGLPKGFMPKWKHAANKCKHCNTPLWRPALKSRGETPNRPRWYIWHIFKRLKKYFEIFIMDEVHQTKSANSARGEAFSQLLKTAKKTLCLTGTLVNGMSTSIQQLLWRVDPVSLIRDGYDHKSGTISWASRYGILERKSEFTFDKKRMVEIKRERVREMPGISPDLVANHLLHRTVFMDLEDLELPLVELKETPVFLNMDDHQMEAYKAFHENLRLACNEAYKKGFLGAYSKFIPSVINYCDRPDAGAEVILEKDGKVFGKVTAPSFPSEYYHAKERKLVETVRANLAEDRGVIVYCNYTDTYKSHHRIHEVLKAHGIKSALLESRVSPEKRVEWLAQKEKEGVKVIVCNMRLVEVGLDLLPWPTIIFYQISYDINTVRQASKRGWRIGQTRECRVYYFIYEGTQQASQFERCVVKRAHALLAEGRLDRSEIGKYVRELDDFLVADLASCIVGEETARKWEELSKKDIDDIETVEEAFFAEALHKRQIKLAQRTLALCGIEDDIEIDTRKTIFDFDICLPRRKKRLPKIPGFKQTILFEVS